MVYEYSSDEQLQNKLESLQQALEKAKAEQKRREDVKNEPAPAEVGLSSPCKSPTVEPADYPECTKNLMEGKNMDVVVKKRIGRKRKENTDAKEKEKVEKNEKVENTDADDTEEKVELKVTEKPNCETCKYKDECVKKEEVVQSKPAAQNKKVIKPKRNPRKNAGKKAHEKRSIKPMDTIVETVEEPASPPVQENALPAEEAKPQVRTVKLTDVSINNQQTALLVVFEFLNYAQTKAVFSIEECAKIWECRKMFTS